jgi:RNA polymerase sigma-70 factor (ECF subfamily)
MDNADVQRLEELVHRWQEGDETAAAEIIEHTCQRLEELTRRMYRRGFERVRRWEETGDILQRALLRLWRSLSAHPPGCLADYFRRAAVAIRRELVDLCRHYFGPRGMATHHDTGKVRTQTDTGQYASLAEQAAAPEQELPSQLVELSEFHLQVNQLPEEERTVFDLMHYHGLSAEQAAAILGVSKRTVFRRWNAARQQLARYLRG